MLTVAAQLWDHGSGVKQSGYLSMLMHSGSVPRFSGPFWLMQRPELEMLEEDSGGGARALWSRKKEEDAEARVKNEKKDPPPPSLFIRQWINGMRRNPGDRKVIMWLHGCLDFREVH